MCFCDAQHAHAGCTHARSMRTKRKHYENIVQSFPAGALRITLIMGSHIRVSYHIALARVIANVECLPRVAAQSGLYAQLRLINNVV